MTTGMYRMYRADGLALRVLAALLVMMLAVYSCDESGNDYSDHAGTADRAERTLR
jgi:hypothetical protein